MKSVLFIYAMLVIIALTTWVVNFNELTNCDFESNYKCEIIHGFGVIVPPASLVTVWFDVDQ